MALLENLQYLSYALNYITKGNAEPHDFKLLLQGQTSKFVYIFRKLGYSLDDVSPNAVLQCLALLLTNLTVEKQLLNNAQFTNHIIQSFKANRTPPNPPVLDATNTPTMTAIGRIQEYNMVTRRAVNDKEAQERMHTRVTKTCGDSGFSAALAFTIFSRRSVGGFNKLVVEHYKALKAYHQWKLHADVFFEFVSANAGIGKTTISRAGSKTAPGKISQQTQHLLDDYKKQY